MQSYSLPYIDRSEKLKRLNSLFDDPWCMLLDSGGNDLNYNRFDIFASNPTVRLSFRKGKIQLEEKPSTLQPDTSKSQPKTNNPLDLMRDYLSVYRQVSYWAESDNAEKSLPFYGGWLGYVSYDFGRYLEDLPESTEDDIALPELQFGLYQWALITDHQLKETNIYNFGLSESEWQNLCRRCSKHILNFPTAEDKNTFHLTSSFKSNTSRREYQSAFNRIQDYIHAGDCYQVNYAQRFQANYHGDIRQAYRELSYYNKAPFSAYLNFQDFQVLSLSPERFIESHNNKVVTQPIKGTRPRSDDPQEDKALGEALKNSLKDRAENLMIVDLLRNDLSRTAAKGSVKVSELFGHYRFESVHHLISTIESKLADGYDNFDLLATTLPGGSITGAPKVRAMEIIEELEKVRRNIYCGIIGYIDFNGNMDTNICIRTLIAKNNSLYCWAGGGLVADSEVDTEYQETFDKLAKILPILSKVSKSAHYDSKTAVDSQLDTQND